MEKSVNIKYKIFSIRLVKKLLTSVLFVFVFEFFLFPAPVLASQAVEIADLTENTEVIPAINPESEDMAIVNTLPQNSDWHIVRAGMYEITAYNSEVAQCDDTPCITANGFNVCEYGIEDTIAANFLKFGAKVKIPELFGNKVFVVRDRMNSRYQNRVDIWMKDKTEAIKFGYKYSRIEILEEP